MNIYAISSDTQECAQALDDLRLAKSCFDVAQALSAAANFMFSAPKILLVNNANHEICLWVRSHPQNFVWAAELYFMLNREHKYRNGYRHVTYTDPLIKTVQMGLARISKQNITITTPAYFLNWAESKKYNIKFLHLPTFVAYRKYLSAVWAKERHITTWTEREQPRWSIDISK